MKTKNEPEMGNNTTGH